MRCRKSESTERQERERGKTRKKSKWRIMGMGKRVVSNDQGVRGSGRRRRKGRGSVFPVFFHGLKISLPSSID